MCVSAFYFDFGFNFTLRHYNTHGQKSSGSPLSNTYLGSSKRFEVTILRMGYQFKESKSVNPTSNVVMC